MGHIPPGTSSNPPSSSSQLAVLGQSFGVESIQGSILLFRASQAWFVWRKKKQQTLFSSSGKARFAYLPTLSWECVLEEASLPFSSGPWRFPLKPTRESSKHWIRICGLRARSLLELVGVHSPLTERGGFHVQRGRRRFSRGPRITFTSFRSKSWQVLLFFFFSFQIFFVTTIVTSIVLLFLLL